MERFQIPRSRGSSVSASLCRSKDAAIRSLASPSGGGWQPPIPREAADGRGSSVPHHQHPVPRISPIPTRALRPRRIGSHPLMAPALRPRLPRSPRANPHSPPSCVVGTAIGRPPARSAQSEALSLRASDRRHWLGNPFPPFPSAPLRAVPVPVPGSLYRIARRGRRHLPAAGTPIQKTFGELADCGLLPVK